MYLLQRISLFLGVSQAYIYSLKALHYYIQARNLTFIRSMWPFMHSILHCKAPFLGGSHHSGAKLDVQPWKRHLFHTFSQLKRI